MFKPPRDLLKEYLSTKVALEQTRQRQARLEAFESITLRLCYVPRHLRTATPVLSQVFL